MTTRASMDQFPASDQRDGRPFDRRTGHSVVMLLVAAIIAGALSTWTPSHTLAQASTGPASLLRSVAAGESESGAVAYIWANNPTSEQTSPPDEYYQFNSSGATNTVTRTGVGAYTANFPGIGQEAGTFLATGQGKAASCTIVRWILDGTEMQVDVACDNASGAPIDSGFLVTDSIGWGLFFSSFF